MSENVVIEDFKLKIALDTQILSYLLDKTYPTLNKFIEKLTESPFVNLVCSRFVTYELLGVRKLEHYLREIHSQTVSSNGTMNFSSALKYRYDWSAPELDYKDIYPKIKECIESELQMINDDFGIEYEDKNLHSDIWKPHQDLVLSSKISKEDSLVLMSSVFPNEGYKEDYLIFLTNDEGFYNGYCHDKKIEAIDSIFDENSINQPIANKLKDIKTPLTDKKLNLLKDEPDDDKLESFIHDFILEHIQKKKNSLFLGKTIRCEAKPDISRELICFKLDSEKELRNNIYVTIIPKDLKGVYNHPVKLSGFYSYGEIKSYPYAPNPEEPKTYKISVNIKDEEGNLLQEDLMERITESNNLVFIHPDSVE
ncbi:MAG: hypothetical protein CME35_02590 [Gramella sp.]|nr:hypothetical protein [Christiangramia sp.]|tara:strand:- start:121 stop:1221 length:1101 start_codon:yes stop_codon:yes gene_type:complete